MRSTRHFKWNSLLLVTIFFLGQVCKCGAKNCRGVIGGKGKDYLITIDNNKKALVSNSPMSIGSQLTADAKFYSTKIPPAELTQIKATAPKFAHLENRQIKCTVCNCVLNYKVMFFFQERRGQIN